MRQVWMTFAVSLGLAALLAAAFSAGQAGGVPTRYSVPSPLYLSSARTPRVPLQCVHTKGRYPTFRRPSGGLHAVNTLVRRAVIADQQQWLGARPNHHAQDGGTYSTAVDPRFISASTVVVSVLMPVLRLRCPGGNDGSTWLSATIDVRHRRAVQLGDLLTKRRQALTNLAAVLQRQLMTHNLCVHNSVTGPGAVGNGLALRIDAHTPFSLAPAGLVIGFGQAKIAAPLCGRIVARLPYSVLRPYLNSLGRTLVNGVRKPLLAQR
jgi:hypothetical protein